MLHRRLSLRVSMVILVSAAVIMACAAVTALTLRMSMSTARKAATTAFSDVVTQTHEQIDALMSGTLTEAELGASLPGVAQAPERDALAHPGFATMLRMLRVDASLYSVFVGRDDGTFFQVIALRGDPGVGERLHTPIGAAFVGRTITADPSGHRRQDWAYLDTDGVLLSRRSDSDVDYDPRERPWFRDALDFPGAVLSRSYVFNSSMTRGMTAARMVSGGHAVFGADVTLDGLTRYVSALSVSPNARVFVFDEGLSLLVSSGVAGRGGDGDGRSVLSRMFAEGKVGQPVLLPHDSRQRIAAVSTWAGPRDRRFHIGVIAPLSDFTADFDALIRRVLLIGFLVILAAAPLIYTLSRSMAHTVGGLADDAGRVRNFDFSGKPPRRSFITEFDVLTEAFALMKESLQLRGRELSDVQAKLERLISLGVGMAAERDPSRLMETILVGAKEIANADGGTLYLRTENETLRFEIMHNDQLRIRLGGPGGPPPDMPEVPLFSEDGIANHNNVVSHAVHLERTVAITDAYSAPGYDFSGTREFDDRTGYRSQSFLTVPLKPRGGEVIGAVQLINARHPVGGQVIAFSPEVQSFVEALAAQAATALYNRTLLDSQDRMVDGMIRLVAGAIDAKSPYTGSHCARVPELALMLAEAASTAETGPFADFAFSTQEQWREFRIGAWMHDCGKVTTPEYVIDKATKLETIVNRIHEVRTRFEVLLRDAEIDRLKALLAGEDAEVARVALAERERRLQEDFAFVATCNLGSESMSDADVARLSRIAAQPWQRHFSDRLGLSHGELARLAEIPESPLPATEALLSDRPEHRVPRSTSDPVFDPAHGFNLKVPLLRFDFGELHNLSVRRGTLSPEERAIVNEHIVQTILMLESLNFPKELRRVPEYAGTHHETLIGTGYPRGLTAADLSIPARIMALADVFEALTAADRPYKKAKPLSEAVAILYGMTRERAIDRDVFSLFLRSGVYRHFAEQFLKPEQIDAVDIDAYLPARDS